MDGFDCEGHRFDSLTAEQSLVMSDNPSSEKFCLCGDGDSEGGAW